MRTATIRDELTDSRLRTIDFGLRRARVMSPLRKLNPAADRLATVAGSVLDRVARDLSGTPIGVVMVDRDGRVVARRVDEGDLLVTLDRANVAVGHDWSERYAGTNAFGTTLACGAPIIVRGRAHFAGGLSDVTSAATTIVDPRTGQIVGAVGLVCPLEDTSLLLLPYVSCIARDVEAQLLDETAATDRVLLEHFVRRRRSTRGAMVTLNERAMFTNAAAARIVDDADHAQVWEWAQQRLTRREAQPDDLNLSRGMSVLAQCSPVMSGSDVIGATIRVVGASPARTRRRSASKATSFGWSSLSAAQLGVAELVATGYTNHEAAARLCVSPHTIDFHLRQIFNKLGIGSRVELARIVAQQRAA